MAQNLDVDVDHYKVLGLPSGEEASKFSDKEITKAYRSKARELHPDKRPDDPDAHSNFQKLKSSYDILRDEKARKLFDELLRVKRERQQRQLQSDAKRQKMVSDLEERERAAFAPDCGAKSQTEEENISRKLKEEIARIRAMHANKPSPATSFSKKETAKIGRESKVNDEDRLDKKKVLKVSWEKVAEGYSAQRLKEVFEKFGEVEDVVIKSSKKRGSALIVMASKDAAAAATGSVSGDISNPLLVLPLQPDIAESEYQSVPKVVEPDPLQNLVGAGYKAFEDSVLQKLQKAAKRQT